MDWQNREKTRPRSGEKKRRHRIRNKERNSIEIVVKKVD